MYRIIEGQRYKMICINDEYTVDSFEAEKEKLITAFERVLSEKSSFEL